MQSNSDAHQRNKGAGLERHFHTSSVVIAAVLARIQQCAVQWFTWFKTADNQSGVYPLRMSYVPARVPVYAQDRVSTQRALHARDVKV